MTVGNNNDSERGVERNNHGNEQAIDAVLTTQPELGPSIPDGGYGWVIFFATLCFQATIPNLIVAYGIFMAFTTLYNDDEEKTSIPRIWDENIIYVLIFHSASWSIFDPICRNLISHSTWPRLVGVAGICLTSAGLLFMWMGLTNIMDHVPFFYISAGILSGMGGSTQIAQCEILLAQYFKLKLGVLTNISHSVVAIGFIICPILLGYHILQQSLLKVILWYQAVILQGIIVNIAFKKPNYIKFNGPSYQTVSRTYEEEVDIFSRNSRELQTKAKKDVVNNSTTAESNDTSPSTSKSIFEEIAQIENTDEYDKKKLVIFDEDGGDEEEKEKNTETKKNNNARIWETFEDDDDNDDEDNNIKKLPHKLKLAFEDEKNKTSNNTYDDMIYPKPLYNLNSTYSFAEDATEIESPNAPTVFAPNIRTEISVLQTNLYYLKQLTFYKSLLMIITTKFSVLVLYGLFPSYMYLMITNLNMKHLSVFMGILSLGTFVFSLTLQWINIDKKRRAICLWFLCWIGSVGYIMLSDASSMSIFFMGAVNVAVSISALQYVGAPLLGLTVRGESNKQYCLLSTLSGFAFILFTIVNFSYVAVFRFMGVLHFIVGCVWFSNFVYKRIKSIR